MILFNAVLASSDSASASIFNQQKRKKGVWGLWFGSTTTTHKLKLTQQLWQTYTLRLCSLRLPIWVECETSTKKTRCFKNFCLNETDTAKSSRTTKPKLFNWDDLKFVQSFIVHWNKENFHQFCVFFICI